jgi:hypothetical protein
MTFATPWYALIALVGLLPLGVVAERMRAGRILRAELGLARPSLARRLVRPLALVAFFALLGAAAAQPAVRSEQHQRARTDAEIQLVIDNSRSMLASDGPNGTPRFVRALTFARALRADFSEIPIGVSSLTNRVLPYTIPTTQGQVFELALSQSYGIERPPPEATLGAVVSTLGALDDIALTDFFTPGVHKRALVVLTDAESLPFSSEPVLHDLHANGIKPVIVRFWHANERVYKPDGTMERYRPIAPDEVAKLRTLGWAAYDEGQLGDVEKTVRSIVGNGPTHPLAMERLDQPVAPWFALAALVPLAVLLAPLVALRAAGPAARTAGPVRARGASATPAA